MNNDGHISKPETFEPSNVSKPPVKSWSELLASTISQKKPATSTISSCTSSNVSNAVVTGNHLQNTVNQPVKVPLFNANLPKNASNSNSGNSSRASSVLPVETDLLLDSEFLMRTNCIQSRPIVNPGNRCYMISVLQMILHTRPLSNYFLRYFFKLPELEFVLETGRFPLLQAMKRFYSQFKGSNNNNNNFKDSNPAVSHDTLDEIFLALKGKKSGFSTAGFNEQEDAEEFLTALLDALGDEFISIQAQKLISFSLPFERHDNMKNTTTEEDSDDWLQVGPKQRVATTRRTPVNQSPIHSLFAGSFQSLYRAPGIRPSITFEPFTILPLSLMRDSSSSSGIESVEEAIAHVLRCEDLGKKCSKQLSFSSLPPILIIQLKRFIYKNDHHHNLELHKINRPIRIPKKLQLSQNSQPYTYHLYALVNHHGSSLNSGHYTATINKDGDASSWLTFDDDFRIQELDLYGIESVLNKNSSAYLLFYSRLSVNMSELGAV